MTTNSRTDHSPDGRAPFDWLTNTTQVDWSAKIQRLLDIAALNAELLLAEAEEIGEEDEFVGALLARLANSYATTARRLVVEQTS